MHTRGLSTLFYRNIHTLPRQVKLVEVGPRDGIQNRDFVPTATKIELINRLSRTGLRSIEATGFVSPKWIKQFTDSSAVYTAIEKHHDVSYPVLVANLQGYKNAIAAGAKEIAVFTTSSEKFSLKNTNCSVAESLNRLTDVITAAKQNQIRVRAYISCVLGCPYEGDIAPQAVSQLAKKLLEMGCYEISLGDTIGIGTPISTSELLKEMHAQNIPMEQLAGHFHNTYGRALDNIRVALHHGVSTFDSSVGGLGGCPYAKNATGNVATEDVLHLMQRLGIETGVNARRLSETATFILNEVNQPKIESKQSLP